MGLIKAAIGSIGSLLADQWIDYFYCDSIREDVLALKGMKRITAESSNKRGSDNYITSGSIIAVADGQCMLVVEQGKIIDVCDEPGEYIFDSERSRGIFTDETSEAIELLVDRTKKRFTQGGQANLDQRVYFFNTKEIQGNRFGTPSTIPFRVIDTNVGIDMDVALSCYGTFSYRISSPVLFYKNVTGNINGQYLRNRIDEQLESELITALQPAFARLSSQGIRYSALPLHADDICEALNDLLSKKWSELRGIEVVSIAIKGLKIKEEDERIIKELQKNATFRDPAMAAAQLVGSQAEAMKAAASNTNAGAAAAFIGMNMAARTGGSNVQELFQMRGDSKETRFEEDAGKEWTCSCGSINLTNFCPKCGKKREDARRPAFCGNCGKRLPDESFQILFCPHCGAPLK